MVQFCYNHYFLLTSGFLPTAERRGSNFTNQVPCRLVGPISWNPKFGFWFNLSLNRDPSFLTFLNYSKWRRKQKELGLSKAKLTKWNLQVAVFEHNLCNIHWLLKGHRTTPSNGSILLGQKEKMGMSRWVGQIRLPLPLSRVGSNRWVQQRKKVKMSLS